MSSNIAVTGVTAAATALLVVADDTHHHGFNLEALTSFTGIQRITMGCRYQPFRPPPDLGEMPKMEVAPL